MFHELISSTPEQPALPGAFDILPSISIAIVEPGNGPCRLPLQRHLPNFNVRRSGEPKAAPGIHGVSAFL
jgi:hypothetical protein